MPWERIVLVGVGGAFGANARYWASLWISHHADPRFPWATFAVNVLGAFLAGLVAGWLLGHPPHSPWRLLLATGFLGGFTTFSAFELEAVELWRRGEVGRALAYLGGSVGVGFAAALLGVAVGVGAAVSEKNRGPRTETAPTGSIERPDAPSTKSSARTD